MLACLGPQASSHLSLMGCLNFISSCLCVRTTLFVCVVLMRSHVISSLMCSGDRCSLLVAFVVRFRVLVCLRVCELVFVVHVLCDWLIRGVHDRFMCSLLLVLMFVYS